MFIPLKTMLYIINNNTCNHIYENLAYKEGDLHMKIDDSVVCAGIPEEQQSQHQKDHGGNPDACNVRPPMKLFSQNTDAWHSLNSYYISRDITGVIKFS